jgi:primase-polymerase (primpol)-like protein
MNQFNLPEALLPLTAYAQFLLYKLVWDEAKKKHNKIPLNPRTLQVYPKGSNWQQDPSSTATYEEIATLIPQLPEGYGVGYLFTPNDPFFFVDIDKCLQPDNTWSPIATDIMSRLAGAAVEVSQSGIGLHIFGTGTLPEHASKNIPLNIELYTEGRFVALTGTNVIGSAAKDCTEGLARLVNDYFAKREADISEWTTVAVPEYNGPEDDAELIQRASEASSAGAVFGGRATFSDLFTANGDALAAAYPDNEGYRTYDGSSADAALAQHLAFWTGKNCERIERIMKMSALVRDKWDREDYLIRTITRAVGMQTAVYSTGGAVDSTLADSLGAVKLRASSDKQREYAESIRAKKLAEVRHDEALAKRLARIPGARTWIDNESRSGADIAAMVTPVEQACDPLGASTQPTIVTGFQYLAAEQQLEHFKGCVYVQDVHRILTPKGAMLKAEQFNATYGGYIFQLDESGDKVTRKAWEAYTESQIIRYPKAESSCFRPDLQPGAIVDVDGHKLVNSYVPVTTRQQAGDITPFIRHLSLLLPAGRDQEILLSYMAACVQHKGVKFQWTPLIQGTEGNGKTLLTRCVAFAIGDRYTHFPPANEISEKFNEWLFGKLFIGVEDVYVADHKKEVIEVLKPMITNNKLAKRAMQQSQVTADLCANFMLNSNHKDAIRKTTSDRRFAVFYTAQQTAEDLERDGMNGDYFPELYNWLNNGGFAIVNHYLSTYPIPEELNPAGKCHRAPETSSTAEAITSSLGGVEQDIIEAIEENRIGFAGGWVSSVHLDKLLQHTRSAAKISHNKRREILRQLGYDWHPALADGRVNNPIAMDDHKKPRLYIRKGHISAGIDNASDAAKAYINAQSDPVNGAAKEVFGGGD